MEYVDIFQDYHNHCALHNNYTLITRFAVDTPITGSDTGPGTNGTFQRYLAKKKKIFSNCLDIREFNPLDDGTLGPSLASENGLNKLGCNGPWMQRPSTLSQQISQAWLGHFKVQGGEVVQQAFPGGAAVKNPLTNAGDTGDAGPIPWSGRSSGEGDSYPLQYSCLENSMDREAWRPTVHGVTELNTTEQLSACARTHTHSSTMLQSLKYSTRAPETQ